jgi:hypothetical protein
MKRGFFRVWLLLLVAGIFWSVEAVAQRFDWRSRIDELVHKADSLSLVSQQTFHVNKFLTDDRPIRETWHYTVSEGRVVIFEVHYFVDTIEYLEVYYLDRDQVVCMEQYVIEYPAQQDDRIRWGAVGFFQGPFVKQFVTMGLVPDEYSRLSSYDLWSRFKSRYRELSAQRTLQEKNTKGAIFAP